MEFLRDNVNFEGDGLCECEGIVVFSRWGFCVERKVGVAH